MNLHHNNQRMSCFDFVSTGQIDVEMFIRGAFLHNCFDSFYNSVYVFYNPKHNVIYNQHSSASYISKLRNNAHNCVHCLTVMAAINTRFGCVFWISFHIPLRNAFHIQCDGCMQSHRVHHWKLWFKWASSRLLNHSLRQRDGVIKQKSFPCVTLTCN